jgi:asparagine synthetase B (glutamine-hydrolysing)
LSAGNRDSITAGDRVESSQTCEYVRYLSVVRGALITSTDIVEILRARHVANLPVEVDHTAISHLLHDGFVPQPRTVYRDVYAISVDLTATRTGQSIIFDRNFPFTNAKSRKHEKPSTRKLISLLARSVETACTGRSEAILLLSAGVDSTSIAVAAREAGVDKLRCVTYGESPDDFEVNYARDICNKLGLRHEAHIPDLADPSLCRALRKYALASSQPCADPALTACISVVAQFAGARSVVLDGSGSDHYFWRPPPRRLDLLKTWMGLGRMRWMRHLRAQLPMEYRGERILASPFELLLLHGVWPRFYETRKFYPEAVDTHEIWRQEFLESNSFEREEMQHCLKMAYMSPAAYMMKTRNAAMMARATARFPWADEAVSTYCFDLPEEARFDRKQKRSKVIVRKMLTETVGYDHARVGKRAFAFGKHSFLAHHLAFCRDEILGCELWSREIETTFANLSSRLLQGRPTENALLSLLMVSLWHNHWIKGRMRDAIRSNEALAVSVG